jgi:hypothetical protein
MYGGDVLLMQISGNITSEFFLLTANFAHALIESCELGNLAERDESADINICFDGAYRL